MSHDYTTYFGDAPSGTPDVDVRRLVALGQRVLRPATSVYFASWDDHDAPLSVVVARVWSTNNGSSNPRTRGAVDWREVTVPHQGPSPHGRRFDVERAMEQLRRLLCDELDAAATAARGTR